MIATSENELPSSAIADDSPNSAASEDICPGCGNSFKTESMFQPLCGECKMQIEKSLVASESTDRDLITGNSIYCGL